MNFLAKKSNDKIKIRNYLCYFSHFYFILYHFILFSKWCSLSTMHQHSVFFYFYCHSGAKTTNRILLVFYPLFNLQLLIIFVYFSKKRYIKKRDFLLSLFLLFHFPVFLLLPHMYLLLLHPNTQLGNIRKAIILVGCQGVLRSSNTRILF